MKLTWNTQENLIKNKFMTLGETVAQHANYCNQERQFDRKSWNLITNAGIWRLPIPSCYGGEGQDWWLLAAAMEGLATTAKDIGFLLSLISQVGALWILMLYGTEEQKNLYLPRLMNGGIAATAITESSGGSDVARIKTSATRDIANTYRLNGHKVHITNAPIADIIFLAGRMPAMGKHDITLFVLDRTMQGLHFSDPEKMLGNKTSPTGSITLSDVLITDQHIIGMGENGLTVLYKMISFDRFLYGLLCAAVTNHILSNSLQYTKTRFAFGVPISRHQYVQDKLVTMKINMETSRWTTYAALDKLICHHAEASTMCSIAKLVGVEGLIQTVQYYLQLHGHHGYMEGYISRLLTDVIAIRVAGGTSDIQKVNIFKQIQKLHSIEE